MRDSVVAVIQARTGSTRLPGKVLLPLGKATVLEHIVERVMRARLVDEVVVATTIRPEDDGVARLMAAAGVACFRGHPTDLLDRHRQAARAFWADHVVKIPSDCPLIDPEIIDNVLLAYLTAQGRVDYASNLHPATDADGNDVEVMSFRALEAAWLEAARPFEREHTTPFIWTRPDRFHRINVIRPDGRDLSASHRYVLDYPEDYHLVRAIHDALHDPDPFFGADLIADWLDRRPHLAAVNAIHRGKHWYNAHPELLSAVGEPVA